MGFHNTAPPPWLKLSFFREAGQGQVTPSSPQPPADPRSHLLSLRHQALRSSCSRTNQALPSPPGALQQACFPPPHTESPPETGRDTAGPTSPLGLVSNPTAQLSLHTQVCQRRVCTNLHEILSHTHTHTHTFSDSPCKSPVMYYVLCTDKKTKAQKSLLTCPRPNS